MSRASRLAEVLGQEEPGDEQLLEVGLGVGFEDEARLQSGEDELQGSGIHFPRTRSGCLPIASFLLSAV